MADTPDNDDLKDVLSVLGKISKELGVIVSSLSGSKKAIKRAAKSGASEEEKLGAQENKFVKMIIKAHGENLAREEKAIADMNKMRDAANIEYVTREKRVQAQLAKIRDDADREYVTREKKLQDAQSKMRDAANIEYIIREKRAQKEMDDAENSGYKEDTIRRKRAETERSKMIDAAYLEDIVREKAQQAKMAKLYESAERFKHLEDQKKAEKAAQDYETAERIMHLEELKKIEKANRDYENAERTMYLEIQRKQHAEENKQKAAKQKLEKEAEEASKNLMNQSIALLTENFGQFANTVDKAIRTIAGSGGLITKIAGTLMIVVSDLYRESKKISEALGSNLAAGFERSYTRPLNMVKSIFSSGPLAGTEQQENTALGFNKEFGGILISGLEKTLTQSARLINLTGQEYLSGVKTMMPVTGNFVQAEKAFSKTVAEFTKQGLTSRDAVSFLAQNQEMVARYGASASKELAYAAVQARAAGYSLEKIQGFSDSIITDFGSFLSSAAELSSLGLNLPIAELGQAAMAEGAVGVARVLKDSLGDLTNLTQVQQTAISRAVNMPFNELLALQKSDKLNKSLEGTRDKEAVENMSTGSQRWEKIAVLAAPLVGVAGALTLQIGALALNTKALIANTIAKGGATSGITSSLGRLLPIVGRLFAGTAGIGVGVASGIYGANRVAQGDTRQGIGAGMLGGLAGGAMLGASVGSVIPVVGTALGAAVGAIGGGIVGGAGSYLYGNKLQAEAIERGETPELLSESVSKSDSTKAPKVNVAMDTSKIEAKLDALNTAVRSIQVGSGDVYLDGRKVGTSIRKTLEITDALATTKAFSYE